MKMNTGDIIGFSGTGWLSAIINLLTYGVPLRSISHVGIVGEYQGEQVIFESTMHPITPCVIQGKVTTGVQAGRIEDRLANYSGRIHHYPLHTRLYEHEASRLNHFLINHIGFGYDMLGALRAGGRLWSWLESKFREESLDSIFCSELVAAAHREIGCLRTDNVSRWSPNKLVRHERSEKILAPPRRIK